MNKLAEQAKKFAAQASTQASKLEGVLEGAVAKQLKVGERKRLRNKLINEMPADLTEANAFIEEQLKDLNHEHIFALLVPSIRIHSPIFKLIEKSAATGIVAALAVRLTKPQLAHLLFTPSTKNGHKDKKIFWDLLDDYHNHVDSIKLLVGLIDNGDLNQLKLSLDEYISHKLDNNSVQAVLPKLQLQLKLLVEARNPSDWLLGRFRNLDEKLAELIAGFDDAQLTEENGKAIADFNHYAENSGLPYNDCGFVFNALVLKASTVLLKPLVALLTQEACTISLLIPDGDNKENLFIQLLLKGTEDAFATLELLLKNETNESRLKTLTQKGMLFLLKKQNQDSTSEVVRKLIDLRAILLKLTVPAPARLYDQYYADAVNTVKCHAIVDSITMSGNDLSIERLNDVVAELREAPAEAMQEKLASLSNCRNKPMAMATLLAFMPAQAEGYIKSVSRQSDLAHFTSGQHKQTLWQPLQALAKAQSQAILPIVERAVCEAGSEQDNLLRQVIDYSSSNFAFLKSAVGKSTWARRELEAALPAKEATMEFKK